MDTKIDKVVEMTDGTAVKNRLTVQEAVAQYKACVTKVQQEKFIDSLDIKTYLPLADKIKWITNTLYEQVIDIRDDGIWTYDSINKTTYFMLSVIQGYADLVITDEVADFDALMESGLMNDIFEVIDTDGRIYQDMFEMELNDIMRDHNSVEAVINRKMDALLKPINQIIEGATQYIESTGGAEAWIKKIVQEADIK